MDSQDLPLEGFLYKGGNPSVFSWPYPWSLRMFCPRDTKPLGILGIGKSRKSTTGNPVRSESLRDVIILLSSNSSGIHQNWHGTCNVIYPSIYIPTSSNITDHYRQMLRRSRCLSTGRNKHNHINIFHGILPTSAKTVRTLDDIGIWNHLILLIIVWHVICNIVYVTEKE